MILRDCGSDVHYIYQHRHGGTTINRYTRVYQRSPNRGQLAMGGKVPFKRATACWCITFPAVFAVPSRFSYFVYWRKLHGWQRDGVAEYLLAEEKI